MKSRKVLTIDHCFQILLNRVNGLSWQDSIMEAVPARKGAQLKDSESEGDNDEDKQEGDEFEEDNSGEIIEKNDHDVENGVNEVDPNNCVDDGSAAP